MLWKLQREQILPVVDAVIAYFKQNAKPHERRGRLIDRMGIEGLHEFAEKKQSIKGKSIKQCLKRCG